MQSIIALTVSLLALTASAAPTARSSNVQVQFSNIQSGANANAWIPVDDAQRSLGDLYAGTNLVVDGALPVTSLQFTGNFAGVACAVTKTAAGKTVAYISDPGNDFQTFSATPLNWESGFTIACYNA